MGCTDTEHPVMCPSGTCVSDFDDCYSKIYECPLEGNERCGDGVCRENCEGIATNGCPAKDPVYCQNGSCVQFLNQCFDFRCDLDKPILCSDLQCREALSSCPPNSFATMLIETSSEFLARNNSSIMEQISVYSQKDANDLKMTLKGERRNLYFPWYTAGFQINDEKGLDSIDLNVHINPIPMSDMRDTKMAYHKMNLQAEAFTNRIFQRGLSSLKHFQFLRTFVFELDMGDNGYNSLLFNLPMEGLFKFNIVYGYPNTGLAMIDDDDDEDLNHDDDKAVDLIDQEYPTDKPERVYCLGMLNPVSNTWSCVNRVIKEITEESIMYDIPGPGTYAVMFFPMLGDEAEGPCGWLCRNKKAVTTFFIFYIPLLILFGTYFIIVGGKMYREAKQTMKKFEEQMKVKMKLLKQKADDLKRQEQDKGDSLEEEEEKDDLGFSKANPMNQMRYMEKVKQDKDDVNKIRDIMNEANYEVKGQTLTFINPLVFNKEPSSETGKEIVDLETKKVELKFKWKGILTQKLKHLNKIGLLKDEIYHLNTEINHLKTLQGDEVLLEKERNDEEGSLDNQFNTYKTKKPKLRELTTERNLEHDIDDMTGSGHEDDEDQDDNVSIGTPGYESEQT